MFRSRLSSRSVLFRRTTSRSPNQIPDARRYTRFPPLQLSLEGIDTRDSLSTSDEFFGYQDVKVDPPDLSLPKKKKWQFKSFVNDQDALSNPRDEDIVAKRPPPIDHEADLLKLVERYPDAYLFSFDDSSASSSAGNASLKTESLSKSHRKLLGEIGNDSWTAFAQLPLKASTTTSHTFRRLFEIERWQPDTFHAWRRCAEISSLMDIAESRVYGIELTNSKTVSDTARQRGLRARERVARVVLELGLRQCEEVLNGVPSRAILATETFWGLLSRARLLEEDFLRLRDAISAANENARSQPGPSSRPAGQNAKLEMEPTMKLRYAFILARLSCLTSISVSENEQARPQAYRVLDASLFALRLLSRLPADPPLEDPQNDRWITRALVADLIVSGSLRLLDREQLHGLVCKVVQLGISPDRPTMNRMMEFWEQPDLEAKGATLIQAADEAASVVGAEAARTLKTSLRRRLQMAVARLGTLDELVDHIAAAEKGEPLGLDRDYYTTMVSRVLTGHRRPLEHSFLKIKGKNIPEAEARWSMGLQIYRVMLKDGVKPDSFFHEIFINALANWHAPGPWPQGSTPTPESLDSHNPGSVLSHPAQKKNMPLRGFLELMLPQLHGSSASLLLRGWHAKLLTYALRSQDFLSARAIYSLLDLYHDPFDGDVEGDKNPKGLKPLWSPELAPQFEWFLSCAVAPMLAGHQSSSLDIPFVFQLYADALTDGLPMSRQCWFVMAAACAHEARISDLERVFSDALTNFGGDEFLDSLTRAVMKGAAASQNSLVVLKCLDWLRNYFSQFRLSIQNETKSRSALEPVGPGISVYHLALRFAESAPADAFLHSRGLMVLRVFSKLRASHLAVGPSEFDTAIQALTNVSSAGARKNDRPSCHHLRAARLLIDLMETKGLPPTRQIFHSLIDSELQFKPRSPETSRKTRDNLTNALNYFWKSQGGLPTPSGSPINIFNSAAKPVAFVHGSVAGRLMITLSHEGKFEQAKEVREAWFRAVIKTEQDGESEDSKLRKFDQGGDKDIGEEEMMKASELVTELERKRRR